VLKYHFNRFLTCVYRYLTADYERSKFYLSQTRFDPGAPEHIITINSINSTLTSSSSHHHSLPTGAIVGIAIGSLAIIVIILALLYLYIRRRRSLTKSKDKSSWPPENKDDMYGVFGKAELDAKDTANPGEEMETTGVEKHEMGSPEIEDSVSGPLSPLSQRSRLSRLSQAQTVEVEPVHEMPGDGPVVGELPASVERPREVE
jgi:hypothetical protein